MGKFAANAPASAKAAVKTTNLAGGVAYALDLKTELVTHFLTSMVSPTYYESEAQGIKRVSDVLEGLASQGEAKFVAKAAIVARSQFHMRSITHLAAGLLDDHAQGAPWKRAFYKRIVERPDDVTEIVAVAKATGDKKLSNALKRGLGDALRGFDEYQLAKYRGGSGKLKLIDAVNLVHPGESAALTKLATGTLQPAKTWEAGLSAAGNDTEAKAQVWSDLLRENKLGYMAALRNIRNIVEQCPQEKEHLFALLTNPRQVERSKQLPFRFWSAMKVVRKENLGSDAIRALDTALGLSCANVPKLSGATLVAVDFSGSMDSPVAGKNSTTSCREIATLLGCILARHNDSDFIYFGDDAEYHTIHPTDSIMGQMETIAQFNQDWHSWGEHNVGHGTNFGAVFNAANRAYDRILFFTDGQSWGHDGTEVGNYARRTGARPYVYACNLRGSGTSVFNPGNPKMFQLAGFSERIFDLIGAAETGTNVLVENVERTEI